MSKNFLWLALLKLVVLVFGFNESVLSMQGGCYVDLYGKKYETFNDNHTTVLRPWLGRTGFDPFKQKIFPLINPEDLTPEQIRKFGLDLLLLPNHNAGLPYPYRRQEFVREIPAWLYQCYREQEQKGTQDQNQDEVEEISLEDTHEGSTSKSLEERHHAWMGQREEKGKSPADDGAGASSPYELDESPESAFSKKEFLEDQTSATKILNPKPTVRYLPGLIERLNSDAQSRNGELFCREYLSQERRKYGFSNPVAQPGGPTSHNLAVEGTNLAFANNALRKRNLELKKETERLRKIIEDKQHRLRGSLNGLECNSGTEQLAEHDRESQDEKHKEEVKKLEKLNGELHETCDNLIRDINGRDEKIKNYLKSEKVFVLCHEASMAASAAAERASGKALGKVLEMKHEIDLQRELKRIKSEHAESLKELTKKKQSDVKDLEVRLSLVEKANIRAKDALAKELSAKDLSIKELSYRSEALARFIEQLKGEIAQLRKKPQTNDAETQTRIVKKSKSVQSSDPEKKSTAFGPDKASKSVEQETQTEPSLIYGLSELDPEGQEDLRKLFLNQYARNASSDFSNHSAEDALRMLLSTKRAYKTFGKDAKRSATEQGKSASITALNNLQKAKGIATSITKASKVAVSELCSEAAKTALENLKEAFETKRVTGIAKVCSEDVKKTSAVIACLACARAEKAQDEASKKLAEDKWNDFVKASENPFPGVAFGKTADELRSTNAISKEEIFKIIFLPFIKSSVNALKFIFPQSEKELNTIVSHSSIKDMIGNVIFKLVVSDDLCRQILQISTIAALLQTIRVVIFLKEDLSFENAMKDETIEISHEHLEKVSGLLKAYNWACFQIGTCLRQKSAITDLPSILFSIFDVSFILDGKIKNSMIEIFNSAFKSLRAEFNKKCKVEVESRFKDLICVAFGFTEGFYKAPQEAQNPGSKHAIEKPKVFGKAGGSSSSLQHKPPITTATTTLTTPSSKSSSSIPTSSRNKKSAVNNRCVRDIIAENFLGRLKKLNLSGCLKGYQINFDEIITQSKTWFDSQKESVGVDGLKKAYAEAIRGLPDFPRYMLMCIMIASLPGHEKQEKYNKTTFINIEGKVNLSMALDSDVVNFYSQLKEFFSFLLSSMGLKTFTENIVFFLPPGVGVKRLQ